MFKHKIKMDQLILENIKEINKNKDVLDQIEKKIEQRHTKEAFKLGGKENKSCF
ncbi:MULTISPECIES: FbpB family small basic protein [unclassified Cytobacillus]|uniref:FbpB family small basic protein n=1 Tax=unclassified Cytobacillus TaxID=2675268 RepID=UPI0013574567|nr:FbpB family small basic protein [Cytobacillus sp. AMY 15.2]KAF0817729.1 hypothetical protein KIS4809_3547 [Bacillus sp. ZZV12-4809]MCM3093715.1 FbpB family small basic protein [Cytobacillus sp. AMY 15.2]